MSKDYKLDGVASTVELGAGGGTISSTFDVIRLTASSTVNSGSAFTHNEVCSITDVALSLTSGSLYDSSNTVPLGVYFGTQTYDGLTSPTVCQIGSIAVDPSTGSPVDELSNYVLFDGASGTGMYMSAGDDGLTASTTGNTLVDATGTSTIDSTGGTFVQSDVLTTVSGGEGVTISTGTSFEISLGIQTSAMNNGSPSDLAIATKGYVDSSELRSMSQFTIGAGLPTVVSGAVIFVSDANGGDGALCFGNTFASNWIDSTTGSAVTV